ncbi:hypothetical protein [Methanosarcina sp. UBA411]|uniref:hypothetical protein n=1 Tax=Methanosarcina sp. UBA411 TaxID=1915589 RepID=UPI0025D858E5|nr:hypothetical protein [Methanosarcina sp. UBA411]
MKTHRISTTISQKHWELLKKHTEEFGTQQKVLELALESLENSSKQSPELSREERIWLTQKSMKTICPILKDNLKVLLETANIEMFNEYLNKYKPLEYTMEYYFQKPLKEISLKELLDGVVITGGMSNWFDTIDYTDDGNHYTMLITHSLGLNNSKINKMGIESMFETYGVRVESTISEKTIFMKIFKN